MSIDAPSANMLVTPEDEIAFLMEEISRTLRRAFERRIQATGLTRTQWRIIVYLLRTEGMTQTELARALELERATIGQAIDRLEERDLVERRVCASDRRAWRVHASSTARQMMPQLRVEADALYKTLWAGTTRADFENFHEQLRTIAARLASVDDVAVQEDDSSTTNAF